MPPHPVSFLKLIFNLFLMYKERYASPPPDSPYGKFLKWQQEYHAEQEKEKQKEEGMQ